MLSIPYRIIYPAILLFICIGVYSANNNLFDVAVVLFIGVFGYVAARLGYEPAPLLLGLVLGPMVEENFRRALLLSRGDRTVFFTGPIIAVCMLAPGLFVGFRVHRSFRGKNHADMRLPRGVTYACPA